MYFALLAIILYTLPLGNMMLAQIDINKQLRKDVQWKWTDQCEKTFKQATQCLTSP